MDLQLTDRVAVVTASSKGLGRASAEALAQEGARVVMCSRSEAIEEAADEIHEKTGAQVFAIPADVTNQEDIAQLAQLTLEKFGKIDILVLNAGGPPTGKFLDFTVEDWEQAIELTLMSAIRLCYSFVPHMLNQGHGSIVAIESITVKQPVENLILSNSLRLAVIGMLKSLANELGPMGIRVNSINPTFTWTERVERILTEAAKSNGTTIEQEIAKTAANIPLRRMGQADEFGRAVAWLASPAASFIHGHGLMFDGGATKTPL
jgi:3-oxoacyl-[acyl-carrier protein] reductase